MPTPPPKPELESGLSGNGGRITVIVSGGVKVTSPDPKVQVIRKD